MCNRVLLRFVRLLIQRRLVRDMAEEPGTETPIHRLRKSSKSWHGVKLNQPDWSHSSHSIALSAEIVKNRVFIHWILNTWREPLDFELPTDCGRWSRWIDTSLEPHIVTWEEERPIINRSIGLLLIRWWCCFHQFLKKTLQPARP